MPFEDVVHRHGDEGLHVLVELGAFQIHLKAMRFRDTIRCPRDDDEGQRLS